MVMKYVESYFPGSIIYVIIRADFDVLSIWNMHSDDAEIKKRIEDRLRTILNLPESIELKYNKHYSGDAGNSYKKPHGKYVKKDNHSGIFRAKGGEPSSPKKETK